MRDPFLCPDCQKLGYCRKYNTKPQERNFDKEEEAFFQRVNKPKVIFNQEHIATPVKLISLEKIRAQFKKHDDSMHPDLIKVKLDFRLQSIKFPPINKKTQMLSQTFSSKKNSRPTKSELTVTKYC